MQLIDLPSAVAVFHRRGCGACEEYLPRLRQVAERWRSCVPTVLLDTESNSDLAGNLQVLYTPTTFVLRKGRVVHRMEGSADSGEIESAYGRAARECVP